MYQFHSYKYKKARGGKLRVLDITCEHCAQHVTYYQKDGPGLLKRMYVDRFINTVASGDILNCSNCTTILGHKINYKKENRPAYRLFVGAVNKKSVSRNKL